MSEDRPIYIPCASGNNAFADCLFLPKGSVVRLNGHAIMDFSPEDAERLGTLLLEWAKNERRSSVGSSNTLEAIDYYHAPETPQNGSQSVLTASGDAVVDAVVRKMVLRSRIGQQKYGTTLTDNPAELIARLRHWQEELMDAALYAEWTMNELRKDYDDGR